MKPYLSGKSPALFPILLLCFLITPPTVRAGGQNEALLQEEWDNALSSLLLAAGMYGLGEQQQGMRLGLEDNRNSELFHTLSNGMPLEDQSITFSYSGSSGRLDFSAGYIFTSDPAGDDAATILLDPEVSGFKTFDGSTPWFVSLDFSRSFQLNDSFSLGIGSRAMLMKNPFGEGSDRIYSLHFDLPLSYRDIFTITPQLQWSRPVNDGESDQQYRSLYSSHPEKDTFFGGMSISFSY